MDADISRKTEQFFANYPVYTFAKQQLLLRPEEPQPGVFYLLEGRVNQYDVTSTGNEVVVNIFKSGAFFPMSNALNETSIEYFFEAGSVVKAHLAPTADVINFLRTNPDVMLDLLQRVYKGVDGVLRRMAHLMGGNAKHRLLFEIVNAAYRFGEPQPDGSLHIPLHESDLGRHSGLARETVNRSMASLKRAGLLTVTRQGITITDINQLEAQLGNSV